MKEKLFILMGPTAVGKTSVSIELAERLNGEIISADSMQIYKYMDIGTAKISKEEMKGIPHYLLDMIYPDESFTVSNYKELASKYITKLNDKNILPIVVGGTGLYINSLVYNLNFAQVASNDDIRRKLESTRIERGNNYLHNLLKDIDKDSADRISINDTKRIIRALEIYEITGKTMTEYNKNFRLPNEDYDLVMICLNMNREKLYQRINYRVDLMIQSGLIDEVKYILDKGYDKNLVSLQGIGYKEIIMYLENKCSLDEAIEKIKQGSRNYAKRQLTWFRRDNRIRWIDVDCFDDVDDLSDTIQEIVIKNLYIK
ncbi:tRNA (adenosine(37)-N6)-dimethylallyltransferase MiaA [Tissierella sp. Yu-01]|uniref:tRNA (adenosine(37)-N6)-dimethylallyltransferase MiaA n=1 Tax=Tissierella sp. Yu-01 TaxID=3035694 RepID=UPI00240D4535|nr:tRNA (adenosine(37)-N6)-dimethylallyltransferase MiaA [Tissierella sp. Yu-01]WFA09731.1 tRNA (adenosine(37)-N6)-dimethylallyltransferase MiaA [Tissierella sp. Yu-01]